ncbi:MAG: hypothetical protein U5L01_15470 [Rheinheimera sp.]|nr:hypothetical protein [Rheinheimera sp.]
MLPILAEELIPQAVASGFVSKVRAAASTQINKIAPAIALPNNIGSGELPSQNPDEGYGTSNPTKPIHRNKHTKRRVSAAEHNRRPSRTLFTATPGLPGCGVGRVQRRYFIVARLQ